MPEGPEATYLSSIINNKYKGHVLESIEFKSGRYVRHGPPKSYTAFAKDLPAKLNHVESKGKVIFFYFDNGWCIISRLGMTGWWHIKTPEPVNIILKFAPNLPLIFSDFRNFGTISFTKDPAPDIEKLAPDIMNPKTNLNSIISRLNHRKENALIEDAIVDQEFLLSGIGNYLKSEILYAAKISPLRPIKDITKEEWRIILQHAKRITRLMLADKHEMQVYQRDTDPLGNKIQRHKTKSGRTTFWVPDLQL